MKNLRNIFALLILSVAIYSCDADAALDGVEQAEQTEFDVTLSADTGNEGNETEERPDEDDD